MKVRQALNENKTVSTSLALAVVLLAAGFVYWHFKPEYKFNFEVTYFSDDDGQSWYTDDAYLVPPYTHAGKEAVRALIFSYDGGSKKFCGYLSRFPTDAKKDLDAQVEKAKQNNTPLGNIVYKPGIDRMMEVKKPGAGNPWLAVTNPKAADITNVKSPDGSAIDSVLP